MEEKQMQRAHKLVIIGRKTGTVSGISDVLSFDENEIVLDTEMGLLTIKGKNLHISRLTLELGEADLEGKVDSMVYSERGHKKKQEGSLISRLLR
ncbi:MAG: sporulation protein YabP [Marvinbryantia sp.]|uniref:sporulation protein YabP n=1 Tax=Marvinbryantia sp. TaxID=2496532 RepID=UPI002600E4A8|nr:sporulation protein YabP [uncultured Marvinbryantia sp.]